MTQKKFSTNWNSSSQPRKQHKYRYLAPLHLKQKMFHVHLSPELRKKYGLRNIMVRSGDKVKIVRGQFKGKEGKIEHLRLEKGTVLISGIEIIKKDGTKIPFALKPSHLMIKELNLVDKLRKEKLESKNNPKNIQKNEPKVSKTTAKTTSK